MNTFPWLTTIIFLPWLGALALALVPRTKGRLIQTLAMGGSFSTLLLTLCVMAATEPSAGFRAAEQVSWIKGLNVTYHVGLDGMSLLLVLLTAIVGPAALLASGGLARDRAFSALFLLLQGSALGVFLSLDFFPWFVFWEMSLVPGFFLMKFWGGPGSARAAYQFFTYTVGGSAFLLVAFGAIYAAVGTGDFLLLSQLSAKGELLRHFSPVVGLLLFAGVFAGVAVKAALFPIHTWLPDAYAEAPTGASMFFTGVLSKMGVYGFLRILWPLFPDQFHHLATPLLVLALAGVIFGAFAAMRQRDMKRMIAYSSVNHVSYCLLALFSVVAAKTSSPDASSAALMGALLQMFNHGLSAAALFAVAGFLEARFGTRDITALGGVRTAVPALAGLAGVALFSSLGLPGLNGFVGEFMIFRGVFGLLPWAAALACIALLVTAWFLLTFYQKVFCGPVGMRVQGAAKTSAYEWLTLAPLAVLMILIGFLPQWVAGLVSPLVNQWVLSLP